MLHCLSLPSPALAEVWTETYNVVFWCIWTAVCRKSASSIAAVQLYHRDSPSVRKLNVEGPQVQVQRVERRPRFRVPYLRQHLFTEYEMQGVVFLLPIAKKIAGRGVGVSIADNEIKLSAVPFLQHPVVDGEQRVADDPLPLLAKLATFIYINKVFHKQGRRLAVFQER
jgi:hypothetical protein